MEIAIMLSVFSFVYLVALTLVSPFLKVYSQFVSYLKREFDKAGIRGNFKVFLMVSFLSAFILSGVGIYLLDHPAGGLLGLLVFLILPRFLLSIQRVRVRQFERQLVDALFLSANSLKAGFSLLQAFEMVVREMAPPLRDEFEKVVKDIHLGLSTEEALQKLRERIESDDLELLVTAITIQFQTGGNISELFETIAQVIKERLRVQGQVRTMTSQGRLTGGVILLLPAGLWFVISSLDPTFFKPLYSEPIGVVILVIAGFMEFFGILMIKKICTIDF